MNDQTLPVGPLGLAFIACYLVSLLLIGWWGRQARRDDSLRDFYLAGPGVSFLVLLLTLYSTQYSGNTLFGFTGQAYREGYRWLVCVQFMTAIIVVYTIFARQLFRACRRHGFITPTDYLDHRFRSPVLSLVATVAMIAAIANYLVAQLMAMGRLAEGLTQLPPSMAFCGGVVVLAAIIVVYETWGGFRAVAWTDVIQGLVLLFGFGVLLVIVIWRYGPLSGAAARLQDIAPEKLAPPDWAGTRRWLSYIAIVGLGGAMYPQAIQRIYAARSERVLRRSLMVMAFLPLTTTVITVIVGVLAAAYLPTLTADGTDRADTVLGIVFREVQQGSLFGYCLVVLMLSAVLAAIMSTADSVLLTLSSMIAKDIYGRWIRPDATDADLTRFGKVASWLVVALAVALAILLRDHTLVRMLDRKLDILVQLAPAFLLGLRLPRIRGTAIAGGLIMGLIVAVGMSAGGLGKLYGVHAGLYGLLANLLVVGGLSWMGRETAAADR